MPDHYKKGAIPVEPIVVCSRMSFCLGNFVKYVCRAPYKGNELEDLKKALWYINYYTPFAFDKEVAQLHTDKVVCDILKSAPPVVQHLLLDVSHHDIQRLIQDDLNDRIDLLSTQAENEQRN